MYYKVKINHVNEKGSSSVDAYIVAATSVVDAEAKIAESRLFNEYTVESVTKPRISCIITGVGGRYYRCKTILEVSPGKLTPCYDLVQADSFDDAADVLKEAMSNRSSEIEFIQLTSIKGFIK